jgi:hypothetical protein
MLHPVFRDNVLEQVHSSIKLLHLMWRRISHTYLVRCEILIGVNIKIAVFLSVMLSNLVQRWYIRMEQQGPVLWTNDGNQWPIFLFCFHLVISFALLIHFFLCSPLIIQPLFMATSCHWFPRSTGLRPPTQLPLTLSPTRLNVYTEDGGRTVF